MGKFIVDFLLALLGLSRAEKKEDEHNKTKQENAGLRGKIAQQNTVREYEKKRTAREKALDEAETDKETTEVLANRYKPK